MIRRLNKRLWIVFLVALGGVGIYVATAQPAAESAWETEYGPMTLRVAADGSVDGVLPDHDGRIVAEYFTGDRVIAGHWVQPSSEQPCARVFEGSDAWGRLEFRFEGNDGLYGVWSYCDAAPDGSLTWDGRFLGGTHPLSISRR